MSVTIRQTSRPRVMIPSFAEPQMQQIVEFARQQEAQRIARAQNISDAPAKPLTTRIPHQGGAPYAQQKRKLTGNAVRDLRLTGQMLAARVASVIDRLHSVIRFSDPRQAQKAFINEAREPQLGLSPANKQVVDGLVREMFAENVRNTGVSR